MCTTQPIPTKIKNIAFPTDITLKPETFTYLITVYVHLVLLNREKIDPIVTENLVPLSGGETERGQYIDKTLHFI